MGFIDSPAEQTTALTDLLNFLVAIVLAILISRRVHSKDNGIGNLWTVIFLLLGLACGLGAIAHGFDMPEDMKRIVWIPLNLSLGLAVPFFLYVIILEIFGKRRAAKSFPFIICSGMFFFALTLLIPGIFLIFIIFNVITMGFALIGSIHLARTREDPHFKIITGIIIMVIMFSAIFGLLKFTGPLEFKLLFEFDQNGIFHLVQTVVMIILAFSIRDHLKFISKSIDDQDI